MGECLDLVDGLPDGSMYVRAVYPARAWSEQRVLATDMEQYILSGVEALLGVDPERRSRIPRPWDDLLQRARDERAEAEAKRAEEAREYIENQKWEAI